VRPLISIQPNPVASAGHSSDLKPPLLMQAAELFAERMPLREAASALRISKSETGCLRLRALTHGLLVAD
jgi:hypothetical protein